MKIIYKFENINFSNHLNYDIFRTLEEPSLLLKLWTLLLLPCSLSEKYKMKIRVSFRCLYNFHTIDITFESFYIPYLILNEIG